MTKPTGRNLINRLRARRIDQEILDYDYLDKLSPSELEFLAAFSEDYVGSSDSPSLIAQDELRDAWAARKRRVKANKVNLHPLLPTDENTSALTPETILMAREMFREGEFYKPEVAEQTRKNNERKRNRRKK